MEFLLENPFILIALIGIVSSIFKQRKGEGKEDGKQQQKRTITTRTQQPEARPVPRKKVLSPVEDLRNSIEEVLQQTKRTVEPVKVSTHGEYRPVIKEDLTVRPEEKMTQPTTSKRLETINKPEIVNGIIWAEVLGQPRARKPHSAVKPRYRVRN